MHAQTKDGFIYIMSSQRNGTLYTGVTSDLKGRVYKHKAKVHKGFTKRYEVNKLVYYEGPMDIEYAIGKEKQIKKWRRQWKLNVIERMNPMWNDLYDSL